MKNRRYLKKIACLITLAVTLNLTCISISTLAEGTAEENKAVENVQNNVEGQKEEKEKIQQSEEQIDALEKNEQNQVEEQDINNNIPETLKSGWYLDDGNWYYFDADGKCATGWRYINNHWYYLNGEDTQKSGIMSADGMQEIDGRMYAFDPSGAMRHDCWILENEGWYYATTSGAFADGWQYINGDWYFFDKNNAEYPFLMAENGKKAIGDKIYYFTNSGAMRHDCWILEDEGWYYVTASGAFAEGWQYVNGNWYFFEKNNQAYPYLMVSDCKKEISGAEYFFDANGAMRHDCWILEPEGWYYASRSGARVNGWLMIGTKWYYLDPENENYPGLMLSNTERTIAGIYYIFEPSGSMRAGWYKDGDDWYYYDETSGQICSGWKNVGGYWYYLDPGNGNKAFLGGWKVFGGVWYYFNPGGAMATNWAYIGGNWYYLAGDGAMRTGWQWISNNWYYFYYENDSHGGSYGAMARATSIDGWQLQADGSMLSGKQAEMLMKAQTYSSNTNYLILVDRVACKVSIFAGRLGAWNNIKYWDCAPGKPSTPTVSGTYTVQSKGYYFDSGSARCYWYTQFYGNYLFHSVLYSKYNGSLMDGRVGIPLSHGCVRLQIDNAKWIYDNIPRGTKVVIY